MPDLVEPDWISSKEFSLDDCDFLVEKLDNYKIHITESPVSYVYDDIQCRPFETEVIIHIEISTVADSDNESMFFTLNPSCIVNSNQYTDTKTLKSSDGTDIIKKPDRDECVCPLCQKDIVYGTRSVTFTAGSVSSMTHITCWIELIDIVRRIIEENQTQVMSRQI